MERETEIELKSIERRLRAEAKRYLAKNDAADTTHQWTERQILRLTGCQLREIGQLNALKQLKGMLAAQCRWSRIRHPGYDLNRHLTLRRLCKALEADSQRGKPYRAASEEPNRQKVTHNPAAGLLS